jgi:ribokinase
MFERPARASSRVLVAGSVNLDRIYRISATQPEDDQSYVPYVIETLPGGHGSNCAVAAARFGVDTSLLSAVGSDLEGRLLMDALDAEGVGRTLIQTVPSAKTGAVVIPVFDGGHKFMIFDASIRGEISVDPLFSPHVSSRFDVVVAMDLRLPPLLSLLRWSRDRGSIVVLALCSSALVKLAEIPRHLQPDFVIGNEVEMGQHQNGDHLLSSRSSYITTLGHRGCRCVTKEGEEVHAGYIVSSVDAVGAGDCFAGVFAASLAVGHPRARALATANAAAALSTTQQGAQRGYPSAKEVALFLERQIDRYPHPHGISG